MTDAERIERTIAQPEQSLQEEGYWNCADIRDIEYGNSVIKRVITRLKVQLEKLK